MFTVERGDRSEAPNFLYVITDGNSNINPDQTVLEATRMRAEGVYIMTVSVGKWKRVDATKAISGYLHLAMNPHSSPFD